MKKDSNHFFVHLPRTNPYLIYLFSLALLISFSSCFEHKQPSKNFSFDIDEKCMIVNTEQDNTIEGTYLKVLSGGKSTTITVNMPSAFYVDQHNCKNWMLGWGNGVALYDSGCENLRKIISVDTIKKTIELGDLLRGEGFPVDGQRIVFWNNSPSGFIKENKQPLLDLSQWPDFRGSSVGFGSVVYDSMLGKWAMLINEVDTDNIQVYAAVSDDLLHWSAANDGKPVMTAKDFMNTSWAGKNSEGTGQQSAVVSDIIRHAGKWYIFMYGYDMDGRQHIGLAVAEQSLLGPYNIIPYPLISPGQGGTWNDNSCYYGKVTTYKDSFLLFFDRRNRAGEERLGMATSADLMHWDVYTKNPLSTNSGWRSSMKTNEPVFAESRNDSIFLIIAGAKKFKMGWWHHYVTGKMYKDKSGNVNDTELGLFVSADGGKTFTPHCNNPVFINDYSDAGENDHLGGNFEWIRTDTADFIFYQAKSDLPESRYGVFCRIQRR